MAKKIEISEERAAALAAGRIVAKASKKFEGAPRSMDWGEPLKEGEIVEIPKDFEVDQTVIGKTTDAEGNEIDNLVEFTYAAVYDSNGNFSRNMQFFPGMLSKAFIGYRDGKNCGKQKTGGDVAELYAQAAGIQEAFEQIAERGKFRVTRCEEYTVKNKFTDANGRQTNIYSYDFVS